MSTPTREPTPAADWDRRYQTGDLPWDTGVADHNLLETLEMLKLPAGGALEIGCGTGTNAIVLAQHGLRPVVATDVSPRAIGLAQAKAKQAGVEVDFRVHDIVQSLPVEPGSVQFVF